MLNAAYLGVSCKKVAYAEIVISGVLSRQKQIAEQIPFAAIRGTDVVIASQLHNEASLNDHLVWLWGMLKHSRRFLKSVQAEGAVVRCECRAKKGAVVIEPNGAEMLHLLNISCSVEVR